MVCATKESPAQVETLTFFPWLFYIPNHTLRFVDSLQLQSYLLK